MEVTGEFWQISMRCAWWVLTHLVQMELATLIGLEAQQCNFTGIPLWCRRCVLRMCQLPMIYGRLQYTRNWLAADSTSYFSIPSCPFLSPISYAVNTRNTEIQLSPGLCKVRQQSSVFRLRFHISGNPYRKHKWKQASPCLLFCIEICWEFKYALNSTRSWK